MLVFGVLLSAIFAVTSPQAAGSSLRRVCYYTNWSQYRPGAGRYVPENVDPSLCTHYIYAFATLQGNNIKAFEWNDESTAWSKGMYERFMALKQKNPAMKVLLAVGGWNMASGPFTNMVATQQSRGQFIQSATSFLRKNGFDGLDVDWEYPANRGSPAGDRNRFTDLIRELRLAFDAEAASSGQAKLLLSAAVAAGKGNIDTAYDIPQLNQFLDFINLMTYDLHGSWETFTAHQTALFPRKAETGDQRYLNVDYVAKYWVQKGATPSKLNIGVATFGRSFTLSNPSQNSLGATARQAGKAGQFTRENGFLAYYEICQMKQTGGQAHDDPEQFVRYVTKGDQWVGGEDEHTLTQKTCYIKQHGYGGVMVWAIDLDDFSGKVCGKGPYPLLHAINNELNNPSFNNCPNPAAPVAVQTQIPVFGTTQPPFGTQAPYVTRNPYVPQTPGPTAGPFTFAVFGKTASPGGVQTQAPYVPQTPQPTQPPINPTFAVLWNTLNPVKTQAPYVPQTPQPTQRPYVPITHVATQPPYNPTFAVFWNTANPGHTQAPYPPVQTQAPYVPVQTQAPYVPVQTQAPYVPVQTQAHYVPVQTQQPTANNSPLQPYSQRGLNCMNLPSDFYPNPFACEEYFICANQVSYRVRCANGLQYNPVTKHCDWPSNVHCVNLHNPAPQLSPLGLQTQQPIVNTRPPRQTRSPVVYTQRPPVYTQQPPVYTQRPPVYTQQPPVYTQQPPVYTQRPPVYTQQPPVYTQQPPMQTQRPAMFTQTPVYTNAPSGGGNSGSAQSNFCQTRSDGFYPDSGDCTHYYQCSNHVTNYMPCPPALGFNNAKGSCDYAYNIPGCLATIQG
ncbi:hypothetical protein V1264_012567 [Littorina saxatilis]|uniref:Chitinase n=1 Tax=Littorina saxatilis TaxID=31220 RepID=A0AAN9GLN0_9CAEN